MNAAGTGSADSGDVVQLSYDQRTRRHATHEFVKSGLRMRVSPVWNKLSRAL